VHHSIVLLSIALIILGQIRVIIVTLLLRGLPVGRLIDISIGLARPSDAVPHAPLHCECRHFLLFLALQMTALCSLFLSV
jgi:hypothetical protein